MPVYPGALRLARQPYAKPQSQTLNPRAKGALRVFDSGLESDNRYNPHAFFAGSWAGGEKQLNAPSYESLVRAIDRWSLSALMLNTIIGASIFGLPSLLAAQLGKFSPAGYLVTAVGISAIAACLAEVASQFREAGGPYLYTRVSFGQFAAIQIGWLTWLTRIVASAAAAHLFVSYLAQFFPAVEAWAVRAMVLGMLIGFLAVVNYLGVTSGTRLSNFFTAIGRMRQLPEYRDPPQEIRWRTENLTFQIRSS
jgi:hypothetical protein